MGTEIIEIEAWRKQQLAVVGFIYIEHQKYYFRKRIDKKVDPATIELEYGDVLATNGNCHLVLTTVHENAQRINQAMNSI